MSSFTDECCRETVFRMIAKKMGFEATLRMDEIGG